MSPSELSPVDRLATAATEAAGGTDEPCLQGRFHSHITVQVSDGDSLECLRTFCRACRVKLTVVDLADFAGRLQRDVMITRYFAVERDDAVARIVDDLAALGRRLEQSGFPVVRIKLEHESLPTVSQFTRRRYREVHVKLHLPEHDYDVTMQRLKTEMLPLGAAPSRNPYERKEGTVVQFVNLRFYEGDLESTERHIQRVVEQLESAGVSVVDIKRETTVFDTNQGHDQWWA